MKSVDIIVPIFNEEEIIPLFLPRLQAVLADLKKYEFRIIFANNGSSDRSYEIVRQAQKEDSRIGILSLSRNFGYQANLMASRSHSRADVTIFIDVDCEDPPEMIPTFLKYLEEGYDLVYGERGERPESRPMQACRKFFYRFTRSIADSDFIIDMAEFSGFTRRVREVVLSNQTTHPFIRSELAYAGFSRKAIPYDRQSRVAGETHYNIPRMFSFALAGILTSSTFPLRLTAYLGAALFVLNLFDLGWYFFEGASWVHVVTQKVNWIFAIFALASCSLYIARIYKDGFKRPLYVVDYLKSSIQPTENRGVSQNDIYRLEGELV